MISKTNYYGLYIFVRYHRSFWHHNCFKWTINRSTIIKLVDVVTTSPSLPYAHHFGNIISMNHTDLRSTTNIISMNHTDSRNTINIISMNHTDLRNTINIISMNHTDLRNTTNIISMNHTDLRNTINIISMNHTDLRNTTNIISMNHTDLRSEETVPELNIYLHMLQMVNIIGQLAQLSIVILILYSPP